MVDEPETAEETKETPAEGEEALDKKAKDLEAQQ